jgi:pSer/pThr/pTyr-binding forkhead associated (FHA) protein
VRVVIDHVAGTRRGQRQELDASKRIRFGRHPDCEVAFDPYRDIDASSRHAELRPIASAALPGGGESLEAGWVLVDLGSSNGTYVDGQRVTEARVAPRTPLDLLFGPGGPRVRVFVGDEAAIAGLRPPVVVTTWPAWAPWLVPAVGGGALVILLGLLLTRC